MQSTLGMDTGLEQLYMALSLILTVFRGFVP